MSEILGVSSDRAFVQWIVSNRKREIGLLIGSIYVAVVVSGHFLGVLPSGDLFNFFQKLRTDWDWLPSLLQCLALLPLPVVCAMVEPPQWLKPDYRLAIEGCNQFRRSLALLVSAWLVFYLGVFLRQIKVIQAHEEPWIDLLNNLQGVFLFVCYWILTAKTLTSKGTQPEQESRPLWSVYSVLLWSVLVFLIADLSFPTYRILFQLLSGLWVGVSLALLIGCLEGQYLGQPRTVTFFLYLYAALQLAYAGFFQTQNQIQDFATVTSLPLKLLFIGLWCWLLQNGLLAFYMKKTRQDIDDVRHEWEEFQGVQPGLDQTS